MSISRTFVVTVAFVLVAGFARGQEPEPAVRSSMSFHAGYLWPTGGWTDHRFAGVAFFQSGPVFGGELAFRLSDRFALALNGGYSKLDQGDWQAYARSRGSDLTSSASLAYLSALLRPYLKNDAPDLITLDIGPLILFGRGSEKFATHTFDYDFFGSVRWGGQGAIQYCRCLTRSFGVTVRLAVIVVPSALQYADGDSRTLVAFPVTVGVQLFL